MKVTVQKKSLRKIEGVKPRSLQKMCLSLLSSDDAELLFPELADTLLFCIKLLHETLEVNGVKKVFFLSREGQPLKQMFDLYCDRVGVRVQSHYLEVSRRSTLLPSFTSLAEERYETLFRQYRSMSLLEFLSSLGLESYCTELSKELGLSDSQTANRLGDFPSSELFSRLKVLPRFIAIYDHERLARRAAFLRYLITLSDGEIPADLVVVDVGWKGTIQDNLFAMLCREPNSVVTSVTGYYIGLIDQGAAGPNNRKHGLLFSSVNGHTPRFHVFNENRALFEILLAADHGSVASYEMDMNGQARVVHGSFDEQEMLENFVFPVQRNIFERYSQMLDYTTMDVESHTPLVKDVALSHARLVFHPSQAELEWFSTVFHVENYGVFERSFFTAADAVPPLLERLKFMLTVLKRSGRGALGFWPWKKLSERVGRPVAALYGLIRFFQK